MVKNMTLDELKALKYRIRAKWRTLDCCDERLGWLYDYVKAEIIRREKVWR